MERVYQRARRRMPALIDGRPPLPIEIDMPTLDELLAE